MMSRDALDGLDVGDAADVLEPPPGFAAWVAAKIANRAEPPEPEPAEFVEYDLSALMEEP